MAPFLLNNDDISAYVLYFVKNKAQLEREWDGVLNLKSIISRRNGDSYGFVVHQFMSLPKEERKKYEEEVAEHLDRDDRYDVNGKKWVSSDQALQLIHQDLQKNFIATRGVVPNMEVLKIGLKHSAERTLRSACFLMMEVNPMFCSAAGDKAIPAEIALVSFQLSKGVQSTHCWCLELFSFDKYSKFRDEAEHRRDWVHGIPFENLNDLPPPVAEACSSGKFASVRQILKAISPIIGTVSMIMVRREQMKETLMCVDWIRRKCRNIFPAKAKQWSRKRFVCAEDVSDLLMSETCPLIMQKLLGGLDDGRDVSLPCSYHSNMTAEYMNNCALDIAVKFLNELFLTDQTSDSDFDSFSESTLVVGSTEQEASGESDWTTRGDIVSQRPALTSSSGMVSREIHSATGSGAELKKGLEEFPDMKDLAECVYPGNADGGALGNGGSPEPRVVALKSVGSMGYESDDDYFGSVTKRERTAQWVKHQKLLEIQKIQGEKKRPLEASESAAEIIASSAIGLERAEAKIQKQEELRPPTPLATKTPAEVRELEHNTPEMTETDYQQSVEKNKIEATKNPDYVESVKENEGKVASRAVTFSVVGREEIDQKRLPIGSRGIGRGAPLKFL